MTTETELDIIHHVAVQVQNIAEAVDWYQAKFNCQVEYQDKSWAMLKFKNTALALVLPGKHPSHFAILCDDLSAYPQKTIHRDGTIAAYIHDQNDNCIEMLKLP